jgi:hypothetical protein
MNNLGRVIKGAAKGLGCLFSAMLVFGGVIALSDYSVGQSHGQARADGATMAEAVTLIALVAGITLLVVIVRGRIKGNRS